MIVTLFFLKAYDIPKNMHLCFMVKSLCFGFEDLCLCFQTYNLLFMVKDLEEILVHRNGVWGLTYNELILKLK